MLGIESPEPQQALHPTPSTPGEESHRFSTQGPGSPLTPCPLPPWRRRISLASSQNNLAEEVQDDVMIAGPQLEMLPEDVLLHIMYLMDVRELITLRKASANTCRRISVVTKSRIIWLRLLQPLMEGFGVHDGPTTYYPNQMTLAALEHLSTSHARFIHTILSPRLPFFPNVKLVDAIVQPNLYGRVHPREAIGPMVFVPGGRWLIYVARKYTFRAEIVVRDLNDPQTPVTRFPMEANIHSMLVQPHPKWNSHVYVLVGWSKRNVVDTVISTLTIYDLSLASGKMKTMNTISLNHYCFGAVSWSDRVVCCDIYPTGTRVSTTLLYWNWVTDQCTRLVIGSSPSLIPTTHVVTFELKVTPTLILIADCGRGVIKIYQHPTSLHGKPAQISLLPLDTHHSLQTIYLNRTYNSARFADSTLWSTDTPYELQCTCTENGCQCKVFLFFDSPSTSELTHCAIPYSIDSMDTENGRDVMFKAYKTGAPSPFHVPQRVASFVSTVRTPKDEGVKAVTLLTSSEGLFLHTSPFPRPRHEMAPWKHSTGRVIIYSQPGRVTTCATLDVMTGRIATAEAFESKNMCVIKVYEQ